MRISDWSSDVCSSDLLAALRILRYTSAEHQGARHQAAVAERLALDVLHRRLAGAMDRAGLQQSLEQRARVLVVNAEHHVRHHLVELVAGELPATAPARLIRNVEAARRQHRDGDLRKQAQAELALKPREVGE